MNNFNNLLILFSNFFHVDEEPDMDQPSSKRRNTTFQESPIHNLFDDEPTEGILIKKKYVYQSGSDFKAVLNTSFLKIRSHQRKKLDSD